MRSILTRFTPRSAPKLLLAAAALLAPLVFAAPSALADRDDRRDRSDLRSRGEVVVRTSSHDRGSSRSYDRTSRRNVDARYSRSRDRNYGRTFDRGHRDRDRGYVSAPSGYYKQVYRPAVYRTYYDDYGRARRVCVRAARYDRVWVSTGRSHQRSRW